MHPFLRSLLCLGCWVVSLTGAEPILHWTNNLLQFRDPRLPGGTLDIWYLEAFLRPGAQQQSWGKTTLPHRTQQVSTTRNGRELHFLTTVAPAVEVRHSVRAHRDGLDFEFDLKNLGTEASPVQWFQPACIRVAAFTGRTQADYTARSFVFTAQGLTRLDQLHRTTQALYLGGQVYLPPWTNPRDANPRPLAADALNNGLIGCYSADDRWILATASDQTHELFEGVYVCLHSDPVIGGLQPGETKHLRQKLYLVKNDPAALLRRYRRDFPQRPDGRF